MYSAQNLPASVSRFVAESLSIQDHPPPMPKRGQRYARGSACWLCGGATEGVGWPLAVALPPTFTVHPDAACPDSDALCQACAALIDGAVFKDLVARRSLDIKTWTQCGWHNYSHFVTASGLYEAPKPARVREILLDPPDEPFVLALNVSGQKHSLIRAQVAIRRDTFPVHFDDANIFLRVVDFRRCLDDLESMSRLGFAKDQTRTGVYHQESIRRAGVKAWRDGEGRVGVWRRSNPTLLDLAAWCGRSATWFLDQLGAQRCK